MVKKSGRNKKGKKYKEDSGSEDDGSEFEIGSESEDTTSEEEMDEEDEIPFENGQGWPDSLVDYVPHDSEQDVKERANALFALYKDYSQGRRTALTMTKAELVKVVDIRAHLDRKPKEKKALEWLSSKILSLVQSKKKKKKGGSISETDSLLSPAPSIDLTLSQSQTQINSVPLSQSILNPPPTQSTSTNKRESNDVPASPLPKKARAFFTTDEGDGKPMVNGFPINSHPKQYKKNKPGEPTDVQVTEGYALDDDTHM